MDRSGVRTGIIVGVLAAVVIVLGVAVAVLLISDDSRKTTVAPARGSSKEGTTATDGTAVATAPCPTDFGAAFAKNVNLDLRSSGLSCDDSRAVVSDFESQQPYAGESVRASGGWTCQSHSLAIWPLVGDCRMGTRRILLRSNGTGPHGASPIPTVLSSVAKLSCGDVDPPGPGAAYAIKTVGVSCTSGVALPGMWAAVCDRPAPTPCNVPGNFECSTAPSGGEYIQVNCTRSRRNVAFKFVP
jgi:hypothetical protein